MDKQTSVVNKKTLMVVNKMYEQTESMAKFINEILEKSKNEKFDKYKNKSLRREMPN